jgi:hypothetical protein
MDANEIRYGKYYPCKFTDAEISVLKSAGYQNSDILYLELTGKDFTEIQGERGAESLKTTLSLINMCH